MVPLGSFRPHVCILHKDDLKGASRCEPPEYVWAFSCAGQSRSLCVCVLHRHQLETPGHYSHLAAFYEDKKGVLHAGPGRGGSLPPVYWLPSIHRYMYPEMKVRLVILSYLGIVMVD